MSSRSSSRSDGGTYHYRKKKCSERKLFVLFEKVLFYVVVIAVFANANDDAVAASFTLWIFLVLWCFCWRGETPSNEFCRFPSETLRKTIERRGNSYNPQWTQWNSCNSLLSVCYSSVLPSDQTSSVTPTIWFGLSRFDLTSITETVNFVWAVKV